MAPSRTYRNVAVNTHRLERDMNSHRLLVSWTYGLGLARLRSRCLAGRSHSGCPRLVGVALTWRAHPPGTVTR